MPRSRSSFSNFPICRPFADGGAVDGARTHSRCLSIASRNDPLPYAFQQPDLPRLRLCLPFGASGTCACDRYPFYRALSIMSYNRMWRSREESNLQSLTGYPLSKRGDYHYHTAAYGSGGWNRTTLSRVRTWRPTNGLRRCMGPGRGGESRLPGQKGEK